MRWNAGLATVALIAGLAGCRQQWVERMESFRNWITNRIEAAMIAELKRIWDADCSSAWANAWC